MKYRCPDCKTKIHLYEVYSSFFYCETCKKNFPIEENKDIKIMHEQITYKLYERSNNAVIKLNSFLPESTSKLIVEFNDERIELNRDEVFHIFKFLRKIGKGKYTIDEI